YGEQFTAGHLGRQPGAERRESLVLAALVRLAFALGNLTGTNEANRHRIGVQYGGARSLPNLLRCCGMAWINSWDTRWAMKKRGARPKDRRCEELEGLLVKVARLMANVGINREGGVLMACRSDMRVVSVLLGYCFEVMAEEMPVVPADATSDGCLQPGEELLLNLVSLVTNLSFYGHYPDPEKCNVLFTLAAEDLALMLVDALLHPNR
ncbi:unnamed protein product, partial [Chrysoparadoxa australica]